MSQNLKAGLRVGAMMSLNPATKIVELFGYGVLMWHEIPPPETGLHPHPCPKIVLDNGTVIWGCECHFDREEAIKQKIEGFKVIPADIDLYRQEKAMHKKATHATSGSIN